MNTKTKVEVLAREFCLAYWRGKLSEEVVHTNFTNDEDYVNHCWEGWTPEAKTMLKKLEEIKE